ncbi:MAG: hypothetical protein NT062_12795 [Proteobacteria bacterium]|nr:hypothetical protein [Pseudomonadota bacterium]
MNYFGHAAIARWRALAPAAVLGAMLPDFASMCGGRLIASQPHDVVAEGVALHHHTDRVFHQLPVVTGLMRGLEERLTDLGCARGPTLAVGHIGVELLLDGVFVADAADRAGYLAAIASDASVAWHDDGDARFQVLLDRLRTFGVPDDLRTVDAILYRLKRVLGPRPRLAPSAADLVAIERALGEHQPRVVAAASEVMHGVRTALDG